MFLEVNSEEDLKQVLTNYKDFFVIGGGSNMLLLNDIIKPVIHINTKGKSILQEDEETVLVNVSAGENWHEFVLWCLERNYAGVENLALIPGNVGTAPIQNIGAYGVEVKDVIEAVHFLDIHSLKEEIFLKEDCEFGYRESIFKNKLKGKFVITSVSFRLYKKNYNLKTSYGAIANKLSENAISHPTIQAVAQTVIAVRKEKLPDPDEIGNSGSFFKNPIVTVQEFKKLQQQYPNIPNYPVIKNAEKQDNLIKLAAGWLIDQAGFKGYRLGDAGVHQKQALVLVNYGNATGNEILNVAKKIQETVYKVFEVKLIPEVNIIY